MSLRSAKIIALLVSLLCLLCVLNLRAEQPQAAAPCAQSVQSAHSCVSGDQSDEPWLTRSQDILRQAGQGAMPSWLTGTSSPQVQAKAAVTLQEMKKASQAAQEQAMARASETARKTLAPEADKILVFYSFGHEPLAHMETIARELKDLGENAPGAEIVVRGLPEGLRTLGDLGRFYARVTEGFAKSRPGVRIDPVLFEKYAISQSPTVALERGGHLLAWARGWVSPSWLVGRVGEGSRGDLGLVGQTAEVVERDLIEEIKERLAGIDWEARKEKAWKGYWANHPEIYVNLPPATEARTRYVEPVRRVERDIKAPDGRVVALAGQQVNVLEMIPATYFLVIFDGSIPAQVTKARELAKGAGRLRLKFITTHVADPAHGWESFEDLEKQLGGPVFLLPRNMVEAFQLEKVPATVRAEGKRFRIDEVPAGQTASGPGGAS